ncbi:MAG TPA: glycosyltransferase family 4 protein, partial [Gemmatimonadales bacterium]
MIARVALLTSARAWRGSGTSFVNIARRLAAPDYDVALLTTSPPVTAGFAACGLTAHELPIHDTGIREARLLARTLTRLGTDILLAEKPRDLRLGALVSMVHPIRLIYRYNVGAARPPADLITRLAYRRTRMTIFLTQFAEAAARTHAPFMLRVPSRVIGEGVDLTRFHPDAGTGAAFRQRQGLGERRFLLAVGALEPEKRYDWLLHALTLMEQPPPLLICGEGRLAGMIRATASRDRLDIRLLGQLRPDELASAYNAATCVVHAGAVETFGLSVAEAMACGRAIVAVNGGAVSEVLGDAGVLTDPEDPRAFARAVGD